MSVFTVEEIVERGMKDFVPSLKVPFSADCVILKIVLNNLCSQPFVVESPHDAEEKEGNSVILSLKII